MIVYEMASTPDDVYWLDDPNLKRGHYYRIQDDFVQDVSYVMFNGGDTVFHRVDGPAYIRVQYNDILFALNSKEYKCTKSFCEAAGMSDEDTFMWLLKFGDDLPKTCEEYYGDEWESIPVDQL